MDETGARKTGAGDTIKIHPPVLAGVLLVGTLILHLIGRNHNVGMPPVLFVLSA